jgi:hypothetical protein
MGIKSAAKVRIGKGEKMGKLIYMTPQNGDVQIRWDPKLQDEVSQAAGVFASMRTKGYAAFHVTDSGDTNQIKEFDPKAANILLVPPMVGG